MVTKTNRTLIAIKTAVMLKKANDLWNRSFIPSLVDKYWPEFTKNAVTDRTIVTREVKKNP